MKKLLLTMLFVLIGVSVASAEAFVPNYGYWENSNEISAKKDIIGSINPPQIYDFNTSANAGGEKIVDGKYYIPISYNGGYNGTDTDYIYLDELKGDKGDKGDTGNTGATGSQGIQGLQGVAGQAGQAGVNGLNGVNGQDGAKGDTGAEGKQGVQGNKGEQGVKGDTGKGLENRVELIGDIRVFDTRKWSGDVYGGYDINNKVSIVGAKITYKIGTSYEEREIQKIKQQLNAQLKDEVEKTGEVYITNNGFGIKNKY